MSPDRPDAGDVSGPASLEAFLADLERRMSAVGQRRESLPDSHADLREVAETAELAGRFVQSAESAGCRVRLARTGGWMEAVRAALEAHGVRRLVVEPLAGSALAPERASALEGALARWGVATSRARDDETLFAVDAAVTGVTAAVAETGTLVCASGPDAARGTSLVPPVHIVVVGAAQIVADLFDLFEQLGAEGALPASLCLISGPSKTADIEGVLVTGVHGPGAVEIVLVDEAAAGAGG